MKKFHLLLTLLLATMSAAHAQRIYLMPQASNINGSDLILDDQGATIGSIPGTQYVVTATQLHNWIVGPGTIYVTTGKTETFDNTLSLTGTDGSSVNFGAGGTVLYTTSIGSAGMLSSGAFLQTTNNLGDLASAATARSNLGLNAIASLSLAGAATNNVIYYNGSAWVVGPAAGLNLTVGSNALGVISISSGQVNLINAVNTAGGLAELDGSGNLPANLLGNYTTTFQAYSTQLFNFAGLGSPGVSGAALTSATNGTLSWTGAALGPLATAPMAGATTNDIAIFNGTNWVTGTLPAEGVTTVTNFNTTVGLTLTTSEQLTGVSVTLPRTGRWLILINGGLGFSSYTATAPAQIISFLNVNGTDYDPSNIGVAMLPISSGGNAGMPLIFGPFIYSGASGDVLDLDLYADSNLGTGNVVLYGYTIVAIYLGP